MQCTWRDCTAPLYSSGLCSRHYSRKRVTGTCEDGPKARLPFEQRLWKYIDKRSDAECWPWIGKSGVAGYGKVSTGGRAGKEVLAHRAVWELANGPIPERTDLHHGFVVLHTCDNRACCNPAHLRLGTQGENVADMDAKGRRKTVVKKGVEHHNARYSEDLIRAIKRDSGTPSEVANRHGVPVHVVKNIRYHNAWAHIE